MTKRGIRRIKTVQYQTNSPIHRNGFNAGQVLFLSTAEKDTDSEISHTAKEKLRVLFYAGEPVNEPVVAYGPFVMNTREQIQQAIADYQSGKFDE